jgi:hypothetical protein
MLYEGAKEGIEEEERKQDEKRKRREGDGIYGSRGRGHLISQRKEGPH